MIPTGVGQIVSAMKAIGCKNAEATNSLMDVYPKVNDILARESIQNTDLWWSHVIPQIGHESGLFSKTEENLNYRAARLIEVWPRHFKTLASAAPFAHNPEALAERIYGIDNPSIAKNLGNTKAGDGWAFRGRGWPQMTGRYNYTTSGAYLGIDFLLNPDLARYPKIAWLTTAWFMTRPSMKAAINKDDVEAVTRVLNGGTNGLADRRVLTQKTKAYFASINTSTPRVVLPLLVLGSYGPDVRKLQQLLWDKGFPCGAIDGDFGINTYRALKSFQAAKKLLVDGKAGAQTWRALGAF